MQSMLPFAKSQKNAVNMKFSFWKQKKSNNKYYSISVTLGIWGGDALLPVDL